MNKEDKSVVKSVRINPTLNESLTKIAEKERRSTSNLIAIILEDFVSEYNKKHPTE